MIDSGRQVITLEEYSPRYIPRDEITSTDAEQLWTQHRAHITVEFPSPATRWQWRLTAQGVIGHIPLTPQLTIAIEPKVPLRSIFAMLDFVEGAQPIRYLKDLTQMASIADAYEQLAERLARQVLRRCRDGLVRAYVATTDELSVVRGALNVRRMAQRTWETTLECSYEEHTADIEDNRILAWTLFTICQSGICRADSALPIVLRALRQLQSTVTLTPVSAAACQGRRYHRLNVDYAPLHALCRFFLEHSSPLHGIGDRTMVPFLVNTAQLYERCVAGWLRANLPPTLHLSTQERYQIDRAAGITFAVDMVIRERSNAQGRCVLDTKYKHVGAPSPDDISQVVAYAEALNCRDALLVYPHPPERPLNAQIGDIRVRSVVFTLNDDLDAAGLHLLKQIQTI